MKQLNHPLGQALTGLKLQKLGEDHDQIELNPHAILT